MNTPDKKQPKKKRRWLRRLAGTVLALLALLILTLAALHTPWGRTWSTNKLNSLLASDNISIQIETWEGVLPHNVSIPSFSMTQSNAPLMSATGLVLHADLGDLLQGNLTINTLQADSFRLDALPVSAPTTNPEPEQKEKDGGGGLPEITVRAFDVGNIAIAPDIIPGGLDASLNADLEILPGSSAVANLVLTPTDTSIEPLTLHANLTRHARVTGTLELKTPLIRISETQSVDNIDIQLTLDDRTGTQGATAVVKATYQDLPITVNLDATHQDTLLSLQTLSIASRGLTLTGDATYDTDSGAINGALEWDLDPSHLLELLDETRAKGIINGQVSLQSSNGLQSARATINLTEPGWDTLSLKTIALELDAHAPVQDFFTRPQLTIQMAASDFVKTVTTNTTPILDKLSLETAWRPGSTNALNLLLSAERALTPGIASSNTPTKAEMHASLTSDTFAIKGSIARDTPWINIDTAIPLISSPTNPIPALDPEGTLSGVIDIDIPLRDILLLPEEISGPLRGKILLGGKPDAPTLMAKLNAPKLAIDSDADQLDTSGEALIEIIYTNQIATLNADMNMKKLGTLKTSAHLPLELNLINNTYGVVSNEPANVDISCDLDLEILNALPFFVSQSITGHLDGSLKAQRQGTNLITTGSLKLREGGYEHFVWKTRITDIQADLGLNEHGIVLKGISLSDGAKGTLTGSGRIKIKDQVAEAEMIANRFKLIAAKGVHVMSSGDVTLSADPDHLSLKGEINVDEALIDVAELTFAPKTLDFEVLGEETNAPALPAQPKEEKTKRSNIDIDLALKLNKNLQIKAAILESTWDGTVRYTFADGVQKLGGGLEVANGRIDFLGVWFDFKGGRVTMTDAWPPNPQLAIDAITTRFGVEATLSVGGLASAPTFELTSDPPMHQDEILSFLLFGKSLSEISTTQVMSLAARLHQLRNPNFGTGFSDKAREALNVDYIDLRSDGDDTEIAIGKQINERLHSEIRQPVNNDNSGSVIQLEYELRHNISLDAEIGSEEDSFFGINWKKDY